LNQLYQMNKSDFILTLDGDVVLGRNTDIEEMLKKINDEQVMAVAGHQQPVKPKGFVARISYTSHLLWNETRIPSTMATISLIFTGQLFDQGIFCEVYHLSDSITCDEEYLYIMVKKKDGFRYARNTNILYLRRNQLKNYDGNQTRFLKERYRLVSILESRF